MKLTNTACKNAKPKEKPYKMTDGAGREDNPLPLTHDLLDLENLADVISAAAGM